ncbi:MULTISPECIES: hypothetical protein [Nitrosomonas]|nr:MULTISPECIES: hypothetical protein [Nitrosomonas]
MSIVVNDRNLLNKQNYFLAGPSGIWQNSARRAVFVHDLTIINSLN